MVDNPDHHKTSIFKLRVLRKMNQFLESIGFEKIGLRQLLRPEANLTTELLSVLINYKLYMDTKANQVAHIVNQYPSTEASNVVKERIQAANAGISEHKTACENELPNVKVLENDVKKLKLNINNHNKEFNTLKSKIQHLQDEKKIVDDKISQANYELMKKSQENSKLLSMIVQSPDKVQRTLEEKKADRDEALSAENSSMLAVKEKALKLELYSKGCEKMAKHMRNIQDVLEQSINVPKLLDKDIKTLKAKLIDDELLHTSLEAEIVEANRRANQILESVKAMEREREIKVADNTQRINNLKSEMEIVLHSLKERKLAADANVAKGEKLNREISLVKQKGSSEIHEFMEIQKQLSLEYAKYVQQMSSVFDKFEAECEDE